jgi:hypothetical protein
VLSERLLHKIGVTAEEVSPFKRIIKKHPSSLLIPSMTNNRSLPELKLTERDYNKKHPISDLTEKDILLGRGAMSNHHMGNIWFRDLVHHYRPLYCIAAKGEKGQLARNLVHYVRCSGGRFLEKCKGQWYECGDALAAAKCGQGLREGAATLVRQMLHQSLTTKQHTKAPEKETGTVSEIHA